MTASTAAASSSSLPQYETQRILEAHLTSLGGRIERGVTATKLEADGDEIDVSDQVHTSIMDVADAVRQGRAVHPAIVEPMAAALLGNARAMIDVDYTGAPSSSTTTEPASRDHIPDSATWTGRGSGERRTTCSSSEPRPTPPRSLSWAGA